MKFTDALLTAVIAGGLAGTSPQASAGLLSQPLKYLTLNFNSEIVPNDSDNVLRDLRFNAINHWITWNDPDIITLQEAWDYRGEPSVALTIARAMGYDVVYRIGEGFPGFFYDSNAILAKKSLMMSNEQDLELPHSAPWIGDGKNWVIPFGSVSWAVAAELQLANGDPLLVYSTHLLESSPRDRTDALKAIVTNAKATLADQGIPWKQGNVIVSGDFNSEPTEMGPEYMSQQGFVSAFAATHPGDTSCTNCGDMNRDWFDPIAIGYGLFPSQVSEDTDESIDYVFTHGPDFQALASTLTFTTPYDGVWMSDHYGISVVLGDPSMPAPPNPSHDSADIPSTQIVTITNKDFRCKYPWYPSFPDGYDPGCPANQLPQITVDGARGITVLNRSDYSFKLRFKGPGNIFTARNASLYPGEQAAFSFDTPGKFKLWIRNDADSDDPNRAPAAAHVNVEKTGY